MNRKRILSLFAGLCFSGIFLYFSFKNIPMKELTAYLKTIRYIWMVPSMAVVIFCFLLRTLRWQLIVSTSEPFSFRDAFHPLMIGFMLNCILPARIGELARPAIIQKNQSIPFATGLATIAVERFFDLVFMVISLSFILSVVRMDETISYTYKTYTLNSDTLNALGAKMAIISVLLCMGIGFLCIDRFREMMIRFVQRLPVSLSFNNKKLEHHLTSYMSNPVVALIHHISSGFMLAKRPLRLVLCILITISIWGFQIFSYYLFQYGCPGIHLTFPEMSMVLIIVCFFIALPSVPGYWGLWEAGGIFAMMLFGIPASQSAGFTLANHALQIIPVIIIGLISAMLTSIRIFDFSEKGL